MMCSCAPLTGRGSNRGFRCRWSEGLSSNGRRRDSWDVWLGLHERQVGPDAGILDGADSTNLRVQDIDVEVEIVDGTATAKGLPGILGKEAFAARRLVCLQDASLRLVKQGLLDRRQRMLPARSALRLRPL